MNVKKAKITRIDNSTVLCLGFIAKNTKSEMFRCMTKNGEKICNFLDDCGNFTFEWVSSSRVWIFLNEDGQYIATMQAETDQGALLKKRKRQYLEQLAAYNAANSK